MSWVGRRALALRAGGEVREGLFLRAREGGVQGRDDAKALPGQKHCTAQGALCFALQELPFPFRLGRDARFCRRVPNWQVRPWSGGGPCRAFRCYRVVEEGAQLVGRNSALRLGRCGGRPKGEGFVELAWAGVLFRVEEVWDFLAGFVAPDLCLPQWWELADRGVGVQVAAPRGAI